MTLTTATSPIPRPPRHGRAGKGIGRLFRLTAAAVSAAAVLALYYVVLTRGGSW